MAETAEQNNMLIQLGNMPGSLWTTASCCARRRVPAEGRKRKMASSAHIRSVCKGARFSEGLPERLAKRRIANHPDVACGSTNKYQNWEVVDPEKWVPHGYVCRAGRRARNWTVARGHVDDFLPGRRATYMDASNGPASRPGQTAVSLLNGISYYAINQWQVASLQPPHLKAMCIWGGCGRLVSRHDPPWGHSLDVLGELVRHAGEDRTVRFGGKRASQQSYRCTGLRRRDNVGRRIGA